MPAFRDRRDDRWRYRKWVRLRDGRKERIAGTPAINAFSGNSPRPTKDFAPTMQPEGTCAPFTIDAPCATQTLSPITIGAQRVAPSISCQSESEINTSQAMMQSAPISIDLSVIILLLHVMPLAVDATCPRILRHAFLLTEICTPGPISKLPSILRLAPSPKEIELSKWLPPHGITLTMPSIRTSAFRVR